MRFIFLLFLCVLSGPSYACSCKGIDIKESVRNSKNVFVARIKSVKINGSGDRYLKNVVAEIQVLESIKGNQKGFKRLYSGFGGGDCGITLNVGHQYIVYSDDEVVHACSGSGSYPGKENDDGYTEILRAYIKTGKDFNPEDFFFVELPDAECNKTTNP